MAVIILPYDKALMMYTPTPTPPVSLDLSLPDISPWQQVSGFLAGFGLTFIGLTIGMRDTLAHYELIITFIVLSVTVLSLSIELFPITRSLGYPLSDKFGTRFILTRGSIIAYSLATLCYNVGLGALMTSLIILFADLVIWNAVTIIISFVILELIFMTYLIKPTLTYIGRLHEYTEEAKKEKTDLIRDPFIKRYLIEYNLESAYAIGLAIHIMSMFIIVLLLAFGLAIIGMI